MTNNYSQGQRMSRSVLDPETEIEAGRQRLVRRNWRFSLLPWIILILLLLDLAWEILRLNMGLTCWPWNITILGVGPAATLSGVFGTLLLAREQYARSMRPNLLWSSSYRRSERLDTMAWTLHLLNVGPGLAHVERVRYTLKLVTTAGSVEEKEIAFARVVEAFATAGMVLGSDYHLELVSSGAPLAIVKQPAEGIEIAAFPTGALQIMDRFDLAVQVVDTLGDRHMRSLPFMSTLPDNVARLAIVNKRNPALSSTSLPDESGGSNARDPRERSHGRSGNGKNKRKRR